MVKRILLGMVILLLMVSVVGVFCYASEIKRITLSELEKKADYIVLAQVQNVIKDGDADKVTIKVDSFIKGDSPQKEFTFTLITRGGLKDFDPALKKGDAGVFFLKKEGAEVKKAYWGSIAIFPQNHFDLTKVDQPLQLTIKSDKKVYQVGEEIVLEATLKNNSDKEMIVFWSDENPAQVSGGGGTSLTIFPTPPKAYAIYIKPKEAIQKTISPEASGPTFVLHYVIRDMVLDFKHRPDQEIFIGTLTSNTITIEVVEKK